MFSSSRKRGGADRNLGSWGIGCPVQYAIVHLRRNLAIKSSVLVAHEEVEYLEVRYFYFFFFILFLTLSSEVEELWSFFFF
jgi:hypothetical protein